MKKFYLMLALVILSLPTAISAQRSQGSETFTGTVISYGSGRDTRTRTGLFTLNLTGLTSDADAERYLNVLRSDGQDDLRRAIDDSDLGRFSVGSNVGVPVNVVRQRMEDGKLRIFAVFERWTQFGELRGGYRSLDYPFGVIELFIDPRTGKGEGTYIAAARIRWDRDKKNNRDQIEIENFATFPARLIGVRQRGRKAR